MAVKTERYNSYNELNFVALCQRANKKSHRPLPYCVSNEMFGIQARAGTCWYGQFNGLIVKSINGCSRENVVDR